MKNMGLIIGICIGVVVLLLVGVIVFEGYQRTQVASKQMNQYQVPAYNATPDATTQTQQTSSGLGQQKVSESQSFMSDLNQTQDDGGQQDLQSIDTASQGL
jgi:hypothetical protein